MARQSSIDHYALLNEIDAKSPFIQEHDHSEYEDDLIPENTGSMDEVTGLINWQRAAAMNEKYARDLRWVNHIFVINDLLLQATGQYDISLHGDAFAQAVAAWQQQQGFSGKDADGIIGPNTWRRMQPLLRTIPATPQPSAPTTTSRPSPLNIFEFNKWHAQRIMDKMNAGIFGSNFNSRSQLEKIVRGEQVLRMNPNQTIIKVLPIIDHIGEQAASENYTKIIIGSFIRDASSGKCTGHCAGLCIDINYKNENFNTSGSVEMVIKILNYLVSLPPQFKRSLGFGMPLQGNFFGDQSLTKFKSVSPSYLLNAELRTLVPQLGIVFPDNDNHLHIQVNWGLQESETGYMGEKNWSQDNEEWEDQVPDELSKDWSTAIRLNRKYATQLGWNQFYDKINDLLLPFSGLQNVSLSEEDFAQALSAWQQQQGFSAKDADGILGPNTWTRMQSLLTTVTPSTSTTINTGSTTSNAQAEWTANQGIKTRYPNWQLYDAKRNDVLGWGISNPAPYIENAIQEWNANPGIHRHFDNNFDGDPHRSYLNLKRLYQAKGITNPGNYFSSNIVPVTFFNRSTPGHINLRNALNNAQSSLVSGGHNFNLASAWSFVPRTFNTNTNKLSNHAMGKAIDINPSVNPHIISSEEILVINAVCLSILPGGLLAESNPDTLRLASDYFRTAFNSTWINQQTQSSIINSIQKNSSNLNKYASNGFLNLPSVFIRALQNSGLGWGGAWRSSKDFMHFELP